MAAAIEPARVDGFWRALTSSWAVWRAGLADAATRHRVRRYSRLGLSEAMRPVVWAHMTGAALFRVAYASDFAALSAAAEREPATAAGREAFHGVERDLLRTYPGRAEFCVEAGRGEGTLLAGLRRVLRRFVLARPELGYCQGMNYTAATLLTVLDEATAFWSLLALTQHCLAGYYDTSLSQLQTDIQILDVLCRRHVPRAHAALARLDIALELFLPTWLLTLFARDAPAELVVRVWDVVLHDGVIAVLRFALARLALLAPALEACAGIEAAMEALAAPPGESAERLLGAFHAVRLAPAEVAAAHREAMARERARAREVALAREAFAAAAAAAKRPQAQA